MASKRGWRRYRPPSERRDERGRPVARSKPRATTRVEPDRTPRSVEDRPARTTPKPARKIAGSGSRSSRRGLLIGLAVVAVVVAIVVAARSGDDSDETSGVERDVLEVGFVSDSIERAIAVEGEQAVSLQVSEYGLTVEYFEPNARESRYFETTTYSDGYQLRVEESYYVDYQPRPFDLTVLNPERIVATIEEALASASDPYTFSLRVSADRETGEVSMVADVGADDRVEITRAP